MPACRRWVSREKGSQVTERASWQARAILARISPKRFPPTWVGNTTDKVGWWILRLLRDIVVKPLILWILTWCSMCILEITERTLYYCYCCLCCCCSTWKGKRREIYNLHGGKTMFEKLCFRNSMWNGNPLFAPVLQERNLHSLINALYRMVQSCG